jgi:selenocysteine lyase/cysteine desulfurase
LPAAAAAGSAGGRRPIEDGETYWEMVRRQFAFRDERVPMNAANLCPSPRIVADRVTELTRDIDVDCSFNNRAKFGDLLEDSRSAVAKHLGVSPDEIALVRNTSEANNAINNGLPLKEGDEVVIWDQNHPTNNVAWDVRAARYGIEVKRVATPRTPGGPDELAEVFVRAIGPRTRVIAITHVSNVSGQRLPVREICEVAHRSSIHVHVDGAQSWGALDVDLPALGCDSFAASAHKWFMGPKEAGVLFVKAEKIPEIWPNVVSPGWGDDEEPDVRGARKFESLGQRDDACLAAVGTAGDFHWMIGPDHVEDRVLALAGALKAGFKEMGLELVTPEDPELSGGVCIIDVAQEKRVQIFDRLYQEYGIAGSPAGGLRLSPHVYNTWEHVERALSAVGAMRELII